MPRWRSLPSPGQLCIVARELTICPRSAHDAWASIASIADVLEPKSTNRADFLQECKSGAFDGVVVAYRTFDSVAVTGKIDSEVLDHMPKSLKFLCHNGKRAGRAKLLVVSAT